eukprot:s48_g46.t1
MWVCLNMGYKYPEIATLIYFKTLGKVVRLPNWKFHITWEDVGIEVIIYSLSAVPVCLMLASESTEDLCAFGSDFDVSTGETPLQVFVDSRSSPKDVPKTCKEFVYSVFLPLFGAIIQ